MSDPQPQPQPPFPPNPNQPQPVPGQYPPNPGQYSPNPGQYPPNPGQFQPPPPKKSGLPGWAIALIIVLGSLVVLCGVGTVATIAVLNTISSQTSQVFDQINNEMNSTIASSAVPVETSGAQAIGDTVVAGDLTFVVKSAAKVDPATETLPADEGKEYFKVELDVTNTTSVPVILTALNSSHIQDTSDDVYPVSLFGQSAAGLSSNIVETIPANGTMPLTLVYEVPTAASTLYWIYSEGDATSAVVKIR